MNLFDRLLRRLRKMPQHSLLLIETPTGCPSIFYEEWLWGHPPVGFTTEHFQCEYPLEKGDTNGNPNSQ